MLSDVTKFRSVSRDALRYCADQMREWHTVVFAIVVGSPLSRAMGNFFLGVYKLHGPTRLFSTVEEGLAWLREQRKTREKG
jgi:hypothetical protein